MNNKQILKNKVGFLEQALLEADWTMKTMGLRIDELQKIINDYKEFNNPEDLTQNNDLVITLIKERLKKGAEDYHMNIPITPADDINRDNFYEAVQEALDLSVYLAAYLLRLMEEKERREGEPTTADEHNDKDKYENREEKESSA